MAVSNVGLFELTVLMQFTIVALFFFFGATLVRRVVMIPFSDSEGLDGRRKYSQLKLVSIAPSSIAPLNMLWFVVALLEGWCAAVVRSPASWSSGVNLSEMLALLSLVVFQSLYLSAFVASLIPATLFSVVCFILSIFVAILVRQQILATVLMATIALWQTYIMAMTFGLALANSKRSAKRAVRSMTRGKRRDDDDGGGVY